MPLGNLPQHAWANCPIMMLLASAEIDLLPHSLKIRIRTFFVFGGFRHNWHIAIECFIFGRGPLVSSGLVVQLSSNLIICSSKTVGPFFFAGVYLADFES
jgi:hypothetical protein